MPSPNGLLGFAVVAFTIALTPGPNLIYVLSRSISQGRRAGLIALAGVALGLSSYLLCTVFGITALIAGVPHAYDVLRIGGAIYLLYLGGKALWASRHLGLPAPVIGIDGAGTLFAKGLLTCLLNPAVPMLYFSLLPQFIQPARGSVFAQSIILGSVHIAAVMLVNLLLAIVSGRAASWTVRRSRWVQWQQWGIAGLFLFIAVRMAFSSHK